MLDKNSFKEMLEDFDSFDNDREILIKKSRDIIKLSKQVINAVHRNEDAEAIVGEMMAAFDELKEHVAKNSKLYYQGSFKAAAMEFVEAMLYYSYVAEGKLLTKNDLDVDTNHYILGLADLTGELMRKAILDATKGKFDSIPPIRDVIEEIHTELSRFDLRESEMRRKYDSIKYDLKKIEDLMLELKLKDLAK